MSQYNKEKEQYVDRNNDLFDVVMIANKNGEFIDSVDVTTIISNAEIMNNINISAGNLPGVSYMSHFGAVPEMPQNGSGTIWDINGTFYPWDSLNTAGTVTLRCTINNNTLSTLDSGKTITIYGLDSNYNQITENIIISGSGGSGTIHFKRINNVMINNSNLTNIDLQINSTVVQRISIGKGRSLSSTFTIPAGYTGYLTQGTTSCAATADSTVDMYVRLFNSGFVIGHTLEVSGTGGQYFYPFAVPVKIPEKSDIDVRANVRTNKARITASYDIILVQN